MTDVINVGGAGSSSSIITSLAVTGIVAIGGYLFLKNKVGSVKKDITSTANPFSSQSNFSKKLQRESEQYPMATKTIVENQRFNPKPSIITIKENPIYQRIPDTFNINGKKYSKLTPKETIGTIKNYNSDYAVSSFSQNLKDTLDFTQPINKKQVRSVNFWGIPSFNSPKLNLGLFNNII